MIGSAVNGSEETFSMRMNLQVEFYGYRSSFYSFTRIRVIVNFLNK